MAVGFILGIIIAGLAVFSGIYSFLKLEDRKRKVGTIMAIVTFVLVLAFFIVPFSFHTVETGQVAVVKHLGKATDVKTAGTYFNLWLTNKYQKYDAKVQNTAIEAVAYSNDAQSMTLQMTLQYQIRTDKVLDIANQYGKLSELDSRITAIATEKAKSVMSKYTAMDIIAERASMSPEVEEIIKASVGEEYFVDIIAVVLTDIEFSDAFELAVEEKMIAEQNKLKASYENETKIAKAEAEAQAKLKEAQAKIDIAKAEAEAKKIEAEGEAAANKIISESITEDILNKIIADKWDGKLPTVVGSEGEYILPADILS